MRIRLLAPTDATFAALLLLVLVLLAFGWPVVQEAGSGLAVGDISDFEVERPRSATRLMVNPNHADVQRLTTVPGIGHALAEAIVQFREVHGPFGRLADLKKVPGVGPKRLEKMRPYMALGEGAIWSTK